MQAKTLKFSSASLAVAASLTAGLAMSTAASAQTRPPHHRHPAVMHRAMLMHGPSDAPLAVGTQRPTHEVLLSLGEGELVTLPVSVASIWTSNPDVADVYVDNARQIHLFGKSAGEATVFASTANGTVAYAAKIRVSQNISSVDSLVKLAMPNADVKVTIIGQFAMLTGTVASPEDAAEVVKLVTIALNPGVKPGDDTGLKVGIINRLRTATPLQVNLRVRIAEVSRSLARQIGTNFSSTNRSSGFQYAIGQGSAIATNTTGFYPAAGLGVGLTPSLTTTNPITGVATTYPGQSVASSTTATTIALAGHALGLDILAALNLGEQVGLVTTLAEPNLTAISGETAEFLVGGEFPIPQSTGLGSVSVDYKKYGVSLSYTPVVMADGRITLHVAPEVSELSSQGAVTVNGFSIPALTERRAETTVELGSGQSFMIAGLLQNSASNTIQKMPGAGDLPILGALFKSTNFQKNETELVIVVTPYLVTPVSDRDIKLPTDAVKSPDVVQEVLGDMVAPPSAKGQLTRPLPTAAPVTAASPKVSVSDAPSGQAGSAAASSTSSTAKTADRANAPAATAPGFNLN